MKRYNIVAHEYYNSVQSDTGYWITYSDFVKYQEEVEQKISNVYEWDVVPMGIKWCVQTVFDENFESIKLPNEKLENIVEFLSCALRDELTNE